MPPAPTIPVRQVLHACFTKVRPSPAVEGPKLVAFSKPAADLLDLDETEFERDDTAQIWSVAKLLNGMVSYAQCYGGHQFGMWAGQLGDGRAITLGEVVNRTGERWELQLKGAGRTPYSRMADGLAVLRSSVREFLCSEEMHHLGIPTTRALTLFTTGAGVLRGMFYDGNPKMEPGAVVCRMAQSFLRFGSFQIDAARREQDMVLVKTVADYAIHHHFPEFENSPTEKQESETSDEEVAEGGSKSPNVDLTKNKYAAWLSEVATRTALLISKWQAVAFAHNVMNTDNMSILGLTIDNGPFGISGAFDPKYTDKSGSSIDERCERAYPHAHDGTIAAIVTSMGGQAGAVAIIRLSGPSAVAITSRIFRPAQKSTNGDATSSVWRLKSHRVQYGTLVDLTGALVDEVLVVPMLAPRSYTKEDVVELQCHGGDVCARRVLQICLEAGARLAQPGEFTLRAFLNGRLDLTQAESVAQVVSAKTSLAADTALAGIQGGLSLLVTSLRKECIDLLVEMEARLDFDDEMPVLDSGLLIQRITCMENTVQQALATSNRGQLLQSGLQVAIVGRPNVGKSSLLNAWSQSERAIVTDIPGTTRDVVETGIVVGGISVTLLDTAGIRKTDDLVENLGVQRSEAAAKGADVVLMVISAPDGWTVDDEIIFRQIWGSHESQTATQNNSARVLAGPMTLPMEMSSAAQLPTKTCGAPAILVINKVDQSSSTSVQLPEAVSQSFRKVVVTCAPQRVGLQSLEQALLQLVELGEVKSEGYKWAVNQRQAEQLIRAREALERLKDSVQQQLPIDFWTIDLKEAAIALGQISGDEVSEEVLSNIFSKFCIGK